MLWILLLLPPFLLVVVLGFLKMVMDSLLCCVTVFCVTVYCATGAGNDCRFCYDFNCFSTERLCTEFLSKEFLSAAPEAFALVALSSML